LRLLVNFSTLKTGGGQNVAFNFLYAIDACPMDDIEFYYLVAKDSEVHQYLQRTKSGHYIVAPSNAALRILFEIFLGWYFLKKLEIDIVYSYFGYAWFPKRWSQVSGSVDSNLYYPEIDFWKGYPWISRLKRGLIDFYRLRSVKRANAVVFENKALEEQGRRIHGLKDTKLIKPSIFFSENNSDFKMPSYVSDNGKRGLFLCGWHLNKNIMLIPELAMEMRERKRSFTFLLTAPVDDSKLHKQFSELIEKYKVGEMIFITGPVNKDELYSLYSQIDFVFLLSKLESFSNNIIEAWYFGRPLIVADELWSRSICGDAATYVDRDSVTDIADKLCELLDSSEKYSEKVKRGSRLLLNYPSIQERIKEEIDYVRYVFQKI
jgi:glycosyltransferase involved in cell wall biosynthesis